LQAAGSFGFIQFLWDYMWQVLLLLPTRLLSSNQWLVRVLTFTIITFICWANVMSYSNFQMKCTLGFVSQLQNFLFQEKNGAHVYIPVLGFLLSNSWHAGHSVSWAESADGLVQVVDSMVVERARGESQGTSGSLQSLCWGSSAIGGIVSAYFSGYFVEKFGVR
jgi:hypothetical protein